MKISVDKEAVEELYMCIDRNLAFIRGNIYEHIKNDELSACLIVKMDEIRYFMEKLYNLELIKLKKEARTYYQSWFHLKKTHPETAGACYVKYLECKNRIREIEIPF